MKTDNYILNWAHILRTVLPRIGILGGGLLAVGFISYKLIRIILCLHNRRRLLQQEVVFLELTPLISHVKPAEANKVLIDVIHGLGQTQSEKAKLLLQKLTVSLELVASKEQGIRFIIRAPAQEAGIIQNEITAFSSDVQITEVDDPLPANWRTTKHRLLSFKQIGHWGFSLNIQDSLAAHDPISYIMGALAQLESGEIMAVQYVITPARLKEASVIASKVLSNEDLLTHLRRKHNFSGWNKVFHGINTVLFGAIDLVGEVAHGSAGGKGYSSGVAQQDAQYKRDVARKRKPARTLSTFEEQIVEGVHEKVRQPLFHTSVRAVIVTPDATESKRRAQAIRASLAAFEVPQWQGLRVKRSLPVRAVRNYRLKSYHHRLPDLRLRRSAVLSASEIAALYHFPQRSASQTDNLVTSMSRTLPAPLSLKQTTMFDVVLGRNYHHGTETSIGMREQDRERHVYIIGGTGNGKTTMLQYAIVQDMYSGKGIAVVDPHGDMAETILRHVPQERTKDVIYFNPDDLDHPIGLNLLELTPGLIGNALLREKDLITESVVSVFRKIFSEEDTGGHRIEYVLRNAIHTALTVEGATLFTVLKLLQNATYRKEITDKLEDEDLKDFWKSELGQAGNMQRVKMSAGITAKIGRFNSNAAAKLILGQEKSTIDFEDIINSGKILICNFSKGLLGEDVSELFGITILAKLQLASLRRARIQQVERRPFYLYVDEFQNFATASFVQMLSESRKYKLFMTMAEQSTSQQKDQQVVNIILANVGTVVCFRTGNPADEQLILPLFSPFIENGEIANLSAFNFYAKLSSLQAQEPLSGTTVLLDDNGSEVIATKVIALSQTTYALAPKSTRRTKRLKPKYNSSNEREPEVKVPDL